MERTAEHGDEDIKNKPVDKKAELILGGPVLIPSDMELPVRPSRSTAGPGAGSVGIVLSFQGLRVKKAISREKGEFELVPKEGNKFLLRKNGNVFIEELDILPVVFHAPDQAFFDLDNRCIYGCKFCTAPLLSNGFKKDNTPENVVEKILSAHKEKDFDAVAITSAVPDTPELTIERMIYVVREIKKALPTVTIGVEPYISSLEQIDDLHDAGADEIKLNIETFDPIIFSKVCPKKDYCMTIRAIEHAVQVLGRGKVASNIIVGLGENDKEILHGIDYLADLGCVATLRTLRLNDMNREALINELGQIIPVDQERLLRLVREQKRILEEHTLTTLTFRTMCHRCGCCDILPFVDV